MSPRYGMGGWVGSRASLDDVENILDPTVASRYTDCAIPAPCYRNSFTFFLYKKIYRIFGDVLARIANVFYR
jgi:hypothetical protein